MRGWGASALCLSVWLVMLIAYGWVAAGLAVITAAAVFLATAGSAMDAIDDLTRNCREEVEKVRRETY